MTSKQLKQNGFQLKTIRAKFKRLIKMPYIVKQGKDLLIVDIYYRQNEIQQFLGY